MEVGNSHSSPRSSETSAESSNPTTNCKPFSEPRIKSFFPKTTNASVVSYSGCSVKGHNPISPLKPNQDRLIMIEDRETKSFVIGCLDGHGSHGHLISQYFKLEIESRLCKHPSFRKDLEDAIRNVLIEIENDLFKSYGNAAAFSGTTLSMAIIRDREIWLVNVGDSRIVLGTKEVHSPTLSCPSSSSYDTDSSDDLPEPQATTVSPSQRFVAHDVTIDHKPHLPAEFSRIQSTGGRVFAIQYEDGTIGPPRVWLGKQNIPGLAMSRSLGDFVVHTAGVISTPDIFHYRLNPTADGFLIVATDGLWENLSGQEVIDLAMRYENPSDAIRAILRLSHDRWMHKDTMEDDTSICLVQLTGFHTTHEKM